MLSVAFSYASKVCSIDLKGGEFTGEYLDDKICRDFVSWVGSGTSCSESVETCNSTQVPSHWRLEKF